MATKKERGELALIRKQRGLTQSELAETVGVDRSEVAHWESGKAVPGYWRFRSLREALGVTADALVEALDAVYRRRYPRRLVPGTNGKGSR